METEIDSESYTNLSLSCNLQRNCRFELPFDMKKLENMTPAEYLCKYSVISSRREALYQTVFKKHKNNDNSIPFRRFALALNDVSVCEVDSNGISMLLEISQIKEGADFDEKLFKGICALADRLIFSKLVPEDDKILDQKEGVEKADFYSLDFKLSSTHISPDLKELLKKL